MQADSAPKQETREHYSQGEEKTPLYCHDCGKNFVALLDHSINGNHIIECPHCGHEHCRVMENGRVTEQRWSSRYGNDRTRPNARPRKVWKSDVLKAQTSSASHFMTSLWLDRITS